MESKARLRSPHVQELQVCRMAVLGMFNMESAGAGQQQQEHEDGANILGGWIQGSQGVTTPGDSYMYSV